VRKANPRDEFKSEEAMLQEYCAARGLTYEARELGSPTYQLAKITGPDFCIIAYPHKTSAGNSHIRLRDQGSKNKQAYAEAVGDLYALSGNNCTFQPKHASSVISNEKFMEACKNPQLHGGKP
jgi:hypothetical protein